MTLTFIPPEAIHILWYSLLASPALYPGQTVHATVLSDESNTEAIDVALVIQSYGEADTLVSHFGPSRDLVPGESVELEWQTPALGGAPIVRVGLSVSSAQSSEGKIYLDRLSWDGPPDVMFCRGSTAGNMWQRQWVNAADVFTGEFDEAFRLIQNRGRGLVITGTREWKDYSVQATITPHLAKAFGIAARLQGLERYYALLLLDKDRVQLVKRLYGELVLAEQEYPWQFGQPYALRLDVQGSQIRAWVDGKLLFTVEDSKYPLSNGGIALVCEEGRIGADVVQVKPNSSDTSV